MTMPDQALTPASRRQSLQRSTAIAPGSSLASLFTHGVVADDDDAANARQRCEPRQGFEIVI